MDKKLKLFVACCAIALAAISATTEVKADPSTSGATTIISTETPIDRGISGGCVGSGACGITRNGTALVGKWRE